MKDKIKIGIVDTGIYSQHPYFKGKIEGIYEYRQGKLLSFSLDTCNDMNGHGTACTSVILKECPNAQIYVYKLLDERGEANLLSLEQILLSLLDSKIDVINLSLAITEPIIAPNLKKICKEITSQNKFLVAALGNDRKKSIPSVYSHCYGVKGSILNHLDEIWFNKYKRTQCIVDNTPCKDVKRMLLLYHTRYYICACDVLYISAAKCWIDLYMYADQWNCYMERISARSAY